jgi:hypothetical protein
MTESARDTAAWQEPTPEALAEAKAMLRAADHGALASLRPETGWPHASRVGINCFADGTPLLIASQLTGHFKALVADGRCSLLVGSAGHGDPLAQPRLSLACRATMLAPEDAAVDEARTAYLTRRPKATIYVDLPDFRFFRLAIVEAEFNAGFGRAYRIDARGLVD